MGQRLTRVNELLKREISNQLHREYQTQSVCITITGVDSSPDLRNAKVFYSVFGDKQVQREAGRFLAKHKKQIRFMVGNAIRLKYLPHFEFVFDHSVARGVELINYMDEVDKEDSEEE